MGPDSILALGVFVPQGIEAEAHPSINHKSGHDSQVKVAEPLMGQFVH
jgi:hypothetical protein